MTNNIKHDMEQQLWIHDLIHNLYSFRSCLKTELFDLTFS